MPGSSRRLLSTLLLAVSVILLSACSFDDVEFWKSYDYRIEGLDRHPDLKSQMTKFVKDRFSAVDKAKGRQAQKDQQVYEERVIQADLVKAMQAEGYYDAKADVGETPGKTWSGAYTVTAGDQYTIRSVSVSPAAFTVHLKGLAIAPGQKLLAAPVLKAQTDLFKAIQKNQCYFNLDVKNAVTLDRRLHTADIVFNITAGPPAKFGAVAFAGNTAVKSSYLYELIPWKRGDCWSREKLEAYRTTLFDSGLFSRADAVLPLAPLANGEVPITFQMKERAPRTINASLSYYTDEGPGVTLGWKHRNMFGAGETVETDLTYSELIKSITAKFTKPYFMRKDQSLSLTADFDDEDTDAYKKHGFDTGAAIKRDFMKQLSGTTGIDFTVEHIYNKSTLEDDNYALFSFPQTLTWDTRNNALDPTKGWMLEGLVAPFIDAFGQSPPFWKTQGSARTYVGLTDKATLALRVKAGSILGPSTETIPAPERFYSGGGGSVRGFGYQDIGPFMNNGPTGGRSLAEGSVELRYKVTPTIGFVTFLDMGSVADTVVPNLSNLSFGTGAGLRYYTGFGPLRFDIAVPLNNRQNQPQDYEFYISIGQAF
jgi:translocation and assembly module TamA